MEIDEKNDQKLNQKIDHLLLFVKEIYDNNQQNNIQKIISEQNNEICIEIKQLKKKMIVKYELSIITKIYLVIIHHSFHKNSKIKY